MTPTAKLTSQPEDCPKSPVTDPRPCVMALAPTGAKTITNLDRCMRCGWVDPASLDRWAESWYKSRLTANEARTAMAISGEPFTFVRGSDRDITLAEALAQALGAASMCWENVEYAGAYNGLQAQRIYLEMVKIIREKTGLQDIV